MGNVPRDIIHLQVGGSWVQPEQPLDRVYHFNSLANLAHTIGQADAAIFISHVQKREHLAIHPWIELEVDRPHVEPVFDPQQHPAAASGPGALTPARQGPLLTSESFHRSFERCP
jgi:hypothetical protein